jgi:hypothetical protein
MIISSLSQAQYGDIILFEPTRVLSRIQVWGDNLGQQRKFNYSHGALYLGKEGNTHLMLESITGCGVHITKVQEWANYIIVRPVGYEVRPKDEMLTYLDSKYDYSKIKAVMLNRLFNVPLTVDDDSQVICTELINLAYYYALTKKGMCTPVTLANVIL